MKQNAFAAFCMMFLLATSLVSAGTLTITQDLPSNVDADTTYPVKVVYNNTNLAYPSVNVTFSGTGFNPVITDFTVLNNTAETFNLDLDVPSGSIGTFSEDLTATIMSGGSTLEVLEVTFDANVNEQSYCEFKGMDDTGDLEIVVFDISNTGDGDDEEWDILDEVEIEVVVENTDNDEDVDDVVVEIRVIDEDGDDVTNDFDFDDEEIDLGDIKDGDEETATFIIEEVPVDLDEGDYQIYVVAYSEKDDDQCVSFGDDLEDYGSSEYYAEIEINKEHDEGIIMALENVKFEVACGQDDVTVSAELYNVGDDEEESVLVNLFNDELGIDEYEVIDNFRDGKRKEIFFTFDLPNDMAEKAFYDLNLVTYWDWDDDEDEEDIDAYDENSEDDLDEDYEIRLEIVGTCDGSSSGSGSGSGSGPLQNAPFISAELVSDLVAVGEEVVIQSTISNPHTENLDFVVSVEGYSSWAELLSVQPSIISLNSGESVDVRIRFRPTEAGVQTFAIQLSNSDGEFTQDVSLNVEESSGMGFGDFGEDGVMYWVAVALVVLIVILIVLIIVVAARK